MASGPSQRMEAVKTAVRVLGLGYVFRLRLKVVVGCWIFPGLVTLSFSWAVQLRRLFMQHYCPTLGGFPINWVPLSMRVLYYMSRDRSERRTDPAGLRAGSYSRRHAGWRIET